MMCVHGHRNWLWLGRVIARESLASENENKKGLAPENENKKELALHMIHRTN